MYKKYSSTAGLATKTWGPSGWFFLFSCVMGGYPVTYDDDNKEHRQIKRHFKNMFSSLGYTMPCVFCRESYKQFYKELDIEPFMVSRVQLMKWLYMIRDKVNKKLIAQEKECYNREKKILKNQYKAAEIDKNQYYIKLKELKTDIFITTPSPAFREILEKYEANRATCSKKAKTCAIKKD